VIHAILGKLPGDTNAGEAPMQLMPKQIETFRSTPIVPVEDDAFIPLVRTHAQAAE
jgi:hypothetical protein